ncbi:VRR-NUC domain-containing protein [Gilliamella bombi]|uniref:VRR-NUC domain-containing protein n=1 Tax=Gilliamella bombi TaxID=1908521 RepID=UPI000A14E048|nr:VRR-NUC domain-containing protein [Gilliamella bombi]
MTTMIDKPRARPTSRRSQSATTEKNTSGTVLPVTHPFDIVYLCQKMEAAKKFPFIAKNGTPRYQRQVTMWIRQDAENSEYKFPYCGEVGYNMTQEPPVPLTSNKEPFRPSRYPLSKFRMIYREYRKLNRYGDPEGSYLFDFREVDVVDPMVDKTTLENELSLKRSGDNDIVEAYRTINPDVAKEWFPNGRGMIRIPDVIKKKNYRLLGAAGYHPDNIDTVIEIKFPGDRLSPYQKKDYLKIANNDRNKFRLMTLKQCEFRRRKGKEEEEMLANAKADPLYAIVGEEAVTNTKLALTIEQQMRQEYYVISKHIIKWVNQQEFEYSRPQLLAPDNYNFELAVDAVQRYEQRHEAVVNAPLAAVGVSIIGAMSTAPLVALITEMGATTSVIRNGAEIIKFSPITKTTVAAAATTASLPLAAKQPQTNNYVLEPNQQLTYYAQITEQEKQKYEDDRLIEIDYRYQQKYHFNKLESLFEFEDDSTLTKQSRDRVRMGENKRLIHYYPYRQQFYYYFTPGDEPTTN